jgi:hypothetical protein
MSDYTLETQYKIYDHDCWPMWLIAPDRDSLGCVEIRDNDPNLPTRLTIAPKLALVLAEAIKKCAEDLIKNG